MPIYEYVCGDCGREFEKLVRKTETPQCVACGSESVTRQLSLPAVKSETTKAQAMRAAKKRDKAQATDRVEAQRAYEKSHDD